MKVFYYRMYRRATSQLNDLLTTTMLCKASERCSQAEGKPGVIVLFSSLGRFANVLPSSGPCFTRLLTGYLVLVPRHLNSYWFGTFCPQDIGNTFSFIPFIKLCPIPYLFEISFRYVYRSSTMWEELEIVLWIRPLSLCILDSRKTNEQTTTT